MERNESLEGTAKVHHLKWEDVLRSFNVGSLLILS